VDDLDVCEAGDDGQQQHDQEDPEDPDPAPERGVRARGGPAM
jgi:hypothetical protein